MPSLAGLWLCVLLLLLRWLRPFLQLQCSTKASQETYGLASLALVAALACLAVLGVLCVARLTMRSPSSKRPSARARAARASAQPTLAESCWVAATYALASLALVAALPRLAVLAEAFTRDV